MPMPQDGRRRVVVERVTPQIDCGVFPVKRVLGDVMAVEADVFADGHDHVEARLLYRHEGDEAWQTVQMTPLGNDHWRAEFPLSSLGRYHYTVAGSIDHFDTWRSDLEKRLAAGQDVRVDLQNGGILLEQAARRAGREDAKRLNAAALILRTASGQADSKVIALDPAIAAIVASYPDTALETRYERELSVVVDPVKARFSSWYELFPRSSSPTGGQHGTLRDCIGRLDYVAGLGFDVLYLPPIHPIGTSHRKGRNNAVTAAPGDVGSPWAIGAAEGGHTAVHPELGTLEDLRELVRAAASRGLDVALDIAFQCSPDHPWVVEHPSWFKKRADGSIQYAENPPKKYQDIYPLDFESEDWRGLWQALLDVFLFWIEQGVHIFRVDNPHTKAFAFWEWAIGEIKQRYPEVLFLSEAFTRPRLMQRLAKLGFSQSYTYFTWRNSRQELTDYLEELTRTGVREYLRPNFWPNTPDILPEALQVGGRPAFMVRVMLAATLSSSYGIYGPAYELGENAPMKPGGEEYLFSEKYEIKQWNINSETSLAPLLRELNRARRENAALQSNERLVFHPADNPSLICYSKTSGDGSNAVLIVVNLDYFNTQSGWVTLDLNALGLKAGESFQVLDELTGNRYLWTGAHNYVELSPARIPAHVFRLQRRMRTERDFDYYL